jgi:predicted amidohydrolase
LTTSKKNNQWLVFALPFVTSQTYEDNTQYIQNILLNIDEYTFVVTSELALTSFAYDDFDKASSYSEKAISLLLPLTQNKMLLTTIIHKEKDQYFNRAVLLYNKKIVYTQDKYKLFTLGEETKYFTAGSGVQKFEIDGLKIGILICFELRFTKLWQDLQGCDIIVVPAKWGIERQTHFVSLLKALAITNQCYVVGVDDNAKEYTGLSNICSPSGNQKFKKLIQIIDKQEIKKTRRYINIGLE